MTPLNLLETALFLLKRHPANHELTEQDLLALGQKAARDLSEDRVTWIVTEGNDPEICGDGEFGVKIGEKIFLYYKDDHSTPSSADVSYRPVERYEFGTVIKKP